MMTFNQLLSSLDSRVLKNSSILYNKPQISASVIKNFILTPRKPNSARRKVSQVILSNSKIMFARVIGQGSIPAKYAIVLICGGGYRDTPQVNYKIISGALECLALFSKRRKSSFFGAKKHIN